VCFKQKVAVVKLLSGKDGADTRCMNHTDPERCSEYGSSCFQYGPLGPRRPPESNCQQSRLHDRDLRRRTSLPSHLLNREANGELKASSHFAVDRTLPIHSSRRLGRPSDRHAQLTSQRLSSTTSLTRSTNLFIEPSLQSKKA